MIDDNPSMMLQLLKDKGYIIAPGLTDKDFTRIESAFKAKLPDDYRKLLKAGVPVGEKFPDWSNPKKEAKKTWRWIDNSFRFDIAKNDYWFEEFGEKPSNVRKATKKALQVVHEWPPFFPIYSHRFMSSSPGESGNPVVSLYQAVDSIIYGANIEEYFVNEFDDKKKYHISRSVETIPHWSEALDLPR